MSQGNVKITDSTDSNDHVNSEKNGVPKSSQNLHPPSSCSYIDATTLTVDPPTSLAPGSAGPLTSEESTPSPSPIGTPVSNIKNKLKGTKKRFLGVGIRKSSKEEVVSDKMMKPASIQETKEERKKEASLHKMKRERKVSFKYFSKVKNSNYLEFRKSF